MSRPLAQATGCTSASHNGQTAARSHSLPSSARPITADLRVSPARGSLALRNSVQMLLDQQQTSLKTMVDLGCDFYVQASVPDTHWIYVNVGLGFHAQMTLEEAVAFCRQQEATLTASAEPLAEKVVRLKARIKCIVGAIDEVMTRPSTLRERG